jgi:uncharacterized protein
MSERREGARGWLDTHPSLPYVLPFAIFVALLAAQSYLGFLGRWELPIRALVLAAAIWICSRSVLNFRVERLAASVGLGVVVFLLWIAPDVLFPGYRSHWIFQNPVMGRLGSSIEISLLADPVVLTFRTARAVLLVPVIEELFWRGWLMRWLISMDFRKVPLGTYASGAFWITAILFASEHGPFWDVGLVAGVIYNWWMVRTKSLGDCILMHAVTNACLSIYVISGGHWEYWL